MTSVLQGGEFLNHMNGGGGSEKCLSCSGSSPPSDVACYACQSHICKSCAPHGKNNEMRSCETCSKYCCRGCRDVCQDPDCQAVHCKVCSSMEPCLQCGGVFCTEAVDEMECASRCTCEKIVCNNCNEECTLCNTILCDACLRDCAECSDVFCKACENFVVTCEYCDKEYCLICCAKKTTCVGCGKKPSRPRLVSATAQLKRVQQGMQSGEIVPPIAPIAGQDTSSGSASANANAAAAEADRQAAAEDQRKRQESAAAAEAERKRIADGEKRRAQEKADAAAAAAALEEELEFKRASAAAAEECRKRAEEEAAMNAASADRAAAALAAAVAPGGGQQQRGTNMMPKKAKKKKKSKKKGAAAPAPAPARAPPAPAPAPAPAAATFYSSPSPASSASEMDHSVIKKWVLEVAARKTLATSDQIKRYFHGRVEEDVIAIYLEECDNNCRSTVIQLAQFLDINVPPDNEAQEERYHDEEDSDDGFNQFGDGDGDGGVNDDLVAAAFGAKERTKHGDYSAFEHPLERRANEAKQNDCKDSAKLKDILDEAHGEVGLGKMKKMLKKMIKKINEEREEQKRIRMRSQSQPKPKKEVISQKLHPAYANKEPAYNSFQPPGIPGNRPPDAMMDIPPNVVGWVIGKSGIHIHDLQQRTQATMWMDQNFPAGEMRKLHIHGSKSQVEAAVREVEQLMASAPVNGARQGKMTPEEAARASGGLPPGHPDLPQSSSTTFSREGFHKQVVMCPHALVGYLIGKKGVMIKRIKASSQANVEVFQGFPDGVPRQVIITGSLEEVDLASTMVQEVIAAGTASDNAPLPPALEHPANGGGGGGGASSYGNGGPVMSFSSTPSQASTPPSVGTITHDFGDLGGLGNGAAAGAAMGGHAATGASSAATQMAIDNLHRPAGAAAAAAPAMGAHEEYLVQQEMLRQEHARLDAQWQQQQQAAAAAAANGGGGGGGGGGASPPPFNSVEELLAKAGQLRLLPNFLAQEFDVNAIALMQPQDFDEIGVPFGPQKKIQKAIREATAGLGGAAVAGGGGAGAAPADAAGGAASAPGAGLCAICSENPVQVTFVGCGHVICCSTCGARQVGRPCPWPKCGKMVEQCVRPFTG